MDKQVQENIRGFDMANAADINILEKSLGRESVTMMEMATKQDTKRNKNGTQRQIQNILLYVLLQISPIHAHFQPITLVSQILRKCVEIQIHKRGSKTVNIQFVLWYTST